MSKIKITKSLFGKYRADYECDCCGKELRSSLADVGNKDACPFCGTEFIVPGEKERDDFNRMQQAILESKRQVAENHRKAKQQQAEAQRLKIEIQEKQQLEQEQARRQQVEAQRQQMELRRNQNIEQQQPQQPQVVQVQSQIRCPRCRSTQLTTNSKGFGIGKALAGGFLLGPVGLLGGAIGSAKIKITCLACGHEFQPGKGG